ncbi:MAG: hypothetical protein AABY93_03250 [Bacteroidota bacterium]
MTHVKNTEAFTRLIGFCSGYGGKYNPGRPTLQIDALVNKVIETQSAMEQVKVAKAEYDNDVNQRKQTFDQLSRLVSSILRTLEASGAKPEKLDDARSFAHQLIGSSPKNRAPIPSDQMEQLVKKATVQRSALQLAYVSKADSFSRLVKAVNTEPLYQANETMLSPEGLEAKVEELNHLNRQVADARARWSKALIERNQLMYGSEVSMTKTAQAVKKYVRAIFGHDSEQYALVKSLMFNQPPKR